MPTTSSPALLIASATLLAAVAGCASARPVLHYQRISLSPEPIDQTLLKGPPQTAGMRSGRVALIAGDTMGRHSTEQNEELLVFLQGKARVVLGTENVAMYAGQVLYIPPETEHEVHNDGKEELRYIYTVAPVSR